MLQWKFRTCYFCHYFCSQSHHHPPPNIPLPKTVLWLKKYQQYITGTCGLALSISAPPRDMTCVWAYTIGKGISAKINVFCWSNLFHKISEFLHLQVKSALWMRFEVSSVHLATSKQNYYVWLDFLNFVLFILYFFSLFEIRILFHHQQRSIIFHEKKKCILVKPQFSACWEHTEKIKHSRSFIFKDIYNRIFWKENLVVQYSYLFEVNHTFGIVGFILMKCVNYF